MVDVIESDFSSIDWTDFLALDYSWRCRSSPVTVPSVRSVPSGMAMI